MANYQSAYTGAQIDTAVAKINDFDTSISGTDVQSNLDSYAQEVTTQFSSVNNSISTLNSKLLNATTSSGNIKLTLGNLIIQIITITIPYNTTTVYNFPWAFPSTCVCVLAQGAQVDANGGYSAANSIQTIALSKTQYRIYMNSTVNNATMYAKVIAIGY